MGTNSKRSNRDLQGDTLIVVETEASVSLDLDDANHSPWVYTRPQLGSVRWNVSQGGREICLVKVFQGVPVISTSLGLPVTTLVQGAIECNLR